MTQAEDMVILYNKLGECDSILGKMEQLLDGFKTDLEELTTEIKTLQHDALIMSLKLKNWRAIQYPLTSFIQQISIPKQFEK